MNDSTKVESQFCCDVFSLSISYPEPGLSVTPHDLGCELDCDDLADLLPVHLQVNLQEKCLPEVEAQDFEHLYCWFLA